MSDAPYEHKVIVPLAEAIWKFQYENRKAAVSPADLERIIHGIVAVLINFPEEGEFETMLRREPNFDTIDPPYERNDPKADILRAAVFNLGMRVHQQMAVLGVLSPVTGEFSYVLDELIGGDIILSHF